MAEIKATDVAKLRKMTGAGMMDCKNALAEADGNFDRAQEIIREKGKLVAAKRADRETTEGAVIAKVNENATEGILVALGCETDFVAKTDDFKALANKIANAAIAALPDDKEALEAITVEGSAIAQLISDQTGKSGEKHIIASYERISGNHLESYIHMNNKLATIVAFNKTISVEAGRDIAMQVAAMNPVSISKDVCPPEVIERELQIGREQARLENKPENMIEIIAEGKLKKFFKENTLDSQDFIKDQKISVGQYLKNIDPEVSVTRYVRFSLND
ncbi:MAG: translation elongation factor Ts [Prevotellaceae bacterium]|jgi:elongation factor Ts|nr:translation elongation factor Ts [Prevotellaceae bacterium]